MSQDWVADAAAVIVLAADYERTTQKYGDRGIRYVNIEVGLTAQNIHLQAAALKLGTVIVGAFDDDAVHEVLGLPADQEPIVLMPVGRLPGR